MSTIPFWLDPIFWFALTILTSFWFAGLWLAHKNQMATPAQMTRKGVPHGLNWVAHFGFWHLLLVVHPILAWATAKLWPLWQGRGSWIVLCLLAANIIGYKLQTSWSRKAASPDAWSANGLPNLVGIIHIQHMGFELGGVLMILVSGLWFHEIPIPTFFGIAAIMVNHLIMGTHWPLRSFWFPVWRPKDIKRRLNPFETIALIWCSAALICGGFWLLIVGTI